MGWRWAGFSRETRYYYIEWYGGMVDLQYGMYLYLPRLCASLLYVSTTYHKYLCIIIWYVLCTYKEFSRFLCARKVRPLNSLNPQPSLFFFVQTLFLMLLVDISLWGKHSRHHPQALPGKYVR